MIIASYNTFGQVLSFSGATQGLPEFATSLPLPPVFLIIIMQTVIIIMGAFMDPVAMLMITLPIFIPFLPSPGFKPIWFTAIVVLNIEMAVTSPPFGLCLFVMKAVTKEDFNKI